MDENALVRDPLFQLAAPFPIAIVLFLVVYKLFTSGARKGPVLRVLGVYFMALLLIFLSVWPIYCVGILIRRHQYLVALLPLLYALPYCLLVILLFRPILKYVSLMRTAGHEEARRRLGVWVQRLTRDAPTDKELLSAKGPLTKVSEKLASILQSVVLLPIAFLKAAFAVRLGVRRVAFWPDFTLVLYGLFVVTAYFVAADNHPGAALVVSVYMLVLNVSEVLSKFKVENGVLTMLGYRKSHVGLSNIVAAALIMVGAWGCIHYSVSLMNTHAYSQTLSAVDGLYFSVTTFATVGYGDIFPRIALTKLMCVGEILTGCLTLIFGVNLAMTVWIQRFSGSEKTPSVVTGSSKGPPVAEPENVNHEELPSSEDLPDSRPR